MVLTAGAVFSLTTDPRFALGASGSSGEIELAGLGYTDAGAVFAALALSETGSNNVFLLRTGDIRKRLLDLPSVADADVRVVLPNGLTVAVTERVAVLRVTHGGVTYLLDGDGVVLEARAANAPTLPLPLIDDRRIELGTPFEVGRPIDPTESAAMLQIGALTPALLGSTATNLVLAADDTDGFTVTAEPFGWRAVFGFYTPTLRPPTLIGQQAQCLRNLLAEGEAQIDTIYLAPQGDRCGTYLPRPS
jgi:hypothetical protein